MNLTRFAPRVSRNNIFADRSKIDEDSVARGVDVRIRFHAHPYLDETHVLLDQIDDAAREDALHACPVPCGIYLEGLAKTIREVVGPALHRIVIDVHHRCILFPLRDRLQRPNVFHRHTIRDCVPKGFRLRPHLCLIADVTQVKRAGVHPFLVGGNTHIVPAAIAHAKRNCFFRSFKVIDIRYRLAIINSDRALLRIGIRRHFRDFGANVKIGRRFRRYERQRIDRLGEEFEFCTGLSVHTINCIVRGLFIQSHLVAQRLLAQVHQGEAEGGPIRKRKLRPSSEQALGGELEQVVLFVFHLEIRTRYERCLILDDDLSHDVVDRIIDIGGKSLPVQQNLDAVLDNIEAEIDSIGGPRGRFSRDCESIFQRVVLRRSQRCIVDISIAEGVYRCGNFVEIKRLLQSSLQRAAPWIRPRS